MRGKPRRKNEWKKNRRKRKIGNAMRAKHYFQKMETCLLLQSRMYCPLDNFQWLFLELIFVLLFIWKWITVCVFVVYRSLFALLFSYSFLWYFAIQNEVKLFNVFHGFNDSMIDNDIFILFHPIPCRPFMCVCANVRCWMLNAVTVSVCIWESVDELVSHSIPWNQMKLYRLDATFFACLMCATQTKEM